MELVTSCYYIKVAKFKAFESLQSHMMVTVLHLLAALLVEQAQH